MAKLTKAQRDARRIQRLEQTRLILQSKISVLKAALEKTETELTQLTGNPVHGDVS
jgi:multidrug resistance efflux pump